MLFINKSNKGSGSMVGVVVPESFITVTYPHTHLNY